MSPEGGQAWALRCLDAHPVERATEAIGGATRMVRIVSPQTRLSRCDASQTGTKELGRAGPDKHRTR